MGLSIRLSAFTGLWKDDLAPLKHMIAESMSEKATLLRIIFIVELYEEECFSEIMEASLLNTMDAEGPQPPVVETVCRGVRGQSEAFPAVQRLNNSVRIVSHSQDPSFIFAIIYPDR